MPAQSFTCPNCGASLDAPDVDAATIKCPFCSTQVIVPEELRKPGTAMLYVYTQPRQKNRVLLAALIIGGILLVLGVALIFIFLAAAPSESNAPSQPVGAQSQGGAVEPSKLPQSTATAQPYAVPALTFGEAGTGAGMFSDARYIAVDGSGTIYVGDYQGGRVQAFDQSGKYLRQIKVGDPKTIIHGMAASHAGEVFVAHDASIYRYDGASGRLLGELTNPAGGGFGDMAVVPDGSLDAAWYEGRWGIITTLEGHRDDLVMFDPQGKIIRTIEGFISQQTGETALDNYLAVDGLGNIFTLSDDVIYAFSSAGKYLNHFGSHGNDNPAQLYHASSIAVDGQGQVYVGDSYIVHVFSPDGQFVTTFPAKYAVSDMAFDDKGSLWIVSRDKVTQYVKGK
jgi:hypothetical protein